MSKMEIDSDDEEDYTKEEFLKIFAEKMKGSRLKGKYIFGPMLTKDRFCKENFTLKTVERLELLNQNIQNYRQHYKKKKDQFQYNEQKAAIEEVRVYRTPYIESDVELHYRDGEYNFTPFQTNSILFNMGDYFVKDTVSFSFEGTDELEFGSIDDDFYTCVANIDDTSIAVGTKK